MPVSIAPLKPAVDKNGLAVAGWTKTNGKIFSTTATNEKVFEIPVVDGVRPNYMFVQPGENFSFSVVDDTSSGTTSIANPSGGGGVGTQLYINQPTVITLDANSTHIHFVNGTPTSKIIFSFYS